MLLGFNTIRTATLKPNSSISRQQLTQYRKITTITLHSSIPRNRATTSLLYYNQRCYSEPALERTPSSGSSSVNSVISVSGGTTSNMKDLINNIRDQIKEQQLNHFPINFQGELDELIKQAPVYDGNIKDVLRTVHEAKQVGTKQNLENLENTFYHYMKVGDLERALIAYYDHKDTRQSGNKNEKAIPASPLMCQFMMILAGKKKDPLLIKSIYRDILEIPRLKYSKLMTTILMKSFSLFGEVKILLECYERLYQFGHLPEPIHWYCMLKGASRCGDPKHFARFFYRLVKKDMTPCKGILVALLTEWGQNEDGGWKRSKECNLKEFDFAYIVDIAQRTHNYKLAFRMVQDVYNLDKQPTYQLYEMFMKGVSRDFPAFRHDVRSWRARFSAKYGSVDKATVLEFEEWMNSIKAYIGEENMVKVPIAPTVPRVKTRTTRKDFLRQNNLLKPRTRYTSKFTDDSRLFEFVPQYLRRLETESEEYQVRKKQEWAEKKAEADIELAKEKEREWKRIGFKGEENIMTEEQYNQLRQVSYPQFSTAEYKATETLLGDYEQKEDLDELLEEEEITEKALGEQNEEENEFERELKKFNENSAKEKDNEDSESSSEQHTEILIELFLDDEEKPEAEAKKKDKEKEKEKGEEEE